MAAINFPTATADGQTFEADTGVIYTYNGTPPNGFWTGSFQTTGLNTLDSRYIAKDDDGTVQTIKRSGLKINDNSNDTILLNSDGSASFDGNVGIGTGSPQRLEHLSTSTDTQLRIESTSASGNNEATVEFVRGSNQSAIKNKAGGLEFFTNTLTTEQMRIDKSGRVGIGNTVMSSFTGNSSDNLVVGSGSGGEGITVYSATDNQGSITFADGTSGNAAYRGAVEYSHTADQLAFRTAGTGNRMVIDSSGNVGIATSSPTHDLTVGSTAASDFAIALRGGVGGFFGWDDSANCTIVQAPNTRSLQFQVNSDTFSAGTAAMHISSAANVGIGTSSPGAKLHATGEIRFGSNTNYYGSIDHDAASTGANIYNSVDSGGHIFKRNNTTEQMRIDSSGNVGIGTTSPDSKFVVSNGGAAGIEFGPLNGDIFTYDRTALAYTNLQITSNEFIVRTNGSNERLRIDSSGNVGIGTTSITEKLTVLSNNDSSALDNGLAVYRSAGDDKVNINCQGGAARFISDGGSTYIPTRFSRYNGTTFVTDLTIDTSGRIGIGTTSPGVPLDISSVNSTANLRITDNTNGARIKLVAASTEFDIYNTGGAGYIGTPTNSDILVATNNTERLRIDSSGRLLVGTSSATHSSSTSEISGTNSSYIFSIANSTGSDGDEQRYSYLAFTGTQSGGEKSILASVNAAHDGSADDTKGILVFRTNSGSEGGTIPTERLRIDSSGNVGIGTTSNLLPGSGRTTLSLNNTSSSTIAFGVNGTREGHIFANASSLEISAQDNYMYFTAGSSERMRIDSFGNVGIGITSPAEKLAINGDILVSSGTDATLYLGKGAEGSDGVTKIKAVQTGTDTDELGIAFFTHPSYSGSANSVEKMRIDHSGNMLLRGNTSVWFANYSGAIYNKGEAPSLVIGRTDATGSTGETAVVFTNSSNNVAGSITISSTATAYVTSSDYRLKENVVDIADGITRVKQLQPKRFNFIADADTTVDGFLAHEAQTVVPEAVTGTHNEVEVWDANEELPEGVAVGDNKLDDEGNTIPVMQGIDQAKLVPLLTAALQEAIAKIEILETEVAALKAA